MDVDALGGGGTNYQNFWQCIEVDEGLLVVKRHYPICLINPNNNNSKTVNKHCVIPKTSTQDECIFLLKIVGT